MKNLIKHIHFVGIGGAGMSAIAEILHNLGYIVSGSDAYESPVTERLQALGLSVFIGHAAEHITDAQAVVTSTAVKANNPEVLAARANRIPVVARAVLLAELMRLKQGIAIAGTHGKTTTTSLVASVLAQAGVDPTFVIGGKLQSAGANSRLGAGDYIVVEADESDASFLFLNPIISVVTNIDADHMETYDHDLAKLHDAFVAFLHRLPFYGRAILCIDDAGIQAILPKLERPVITYGFAAEADIRASNIKALAGGKMQFSVHRKGRADLAITLNLAGEHNVGNALAAIAVATVLDLTDAPISQALQGFAGVGRRFEHYGEIAITGGSFTLIDDYGHHPAEIAAVLAAARGAYPNRRLVVAFQPHRYTRTRDCFAEFVAVLSKFDCVLLTEVYAASEEVIAGADGKALAAATPHALFIEDVHQLPSKIISAARCGDVVIVMGAGSIGEVAAQIVM